MLAALLSVLLLGNPAPVPASASLLGRVTTTDGSGVARARVVISELNRAASTDDDGHYRIANLPDGKYLVSVTAIGFKPNAAPVQLAGRDLTYNVTLEHSLVELPSIQVTATADATAASTAPQSTSILNGDALRLAQKPTLGETLEGIAGVRNFSTGIGIGKPVVRGLTNNQVAVLANGLRLETQQWGFEHGPNIETADVERIEVIRGPGSVLYGTDAIGGVINVIAPNLPDASGGKAYAFGSFAGVYNSNNRAPEGTVQLNGASGSFGFRTSFTGRTAGDIRAPNPLDAKGGLLFNSGLRTLGGTTTVGTHGSWGSLTASGGYRDERLQIHQAEAGATPFQRVGDVRGKLEAILPSGSARWELQAGYQRNRRREFGDVSAPDQVEIGFAERNVSSHVHLHHAPIGALTGVIGISGSLTHVSIEQGQNYIIPNSRVWNAGIFAFETLPLGRATLSFGARYDHRQLTRLVTPELGFSTEDRRRYNALTGSVGLVIKTSATTSIVSNVGTGFRAPTPFQLYVNGVHEGTGFYEIGDSTLTTEKSVSTDLAFRVQSRYVSADVGVFGNFLRDFIYIAPNGASTTDGNGITRLVYQTRQGNARMLGFEAAVDVHPAAWLELKGTSDVVRGTNTVTNGPLPFIAPFRVTYAATLRGHGSKTIVKPYLTLGGETNSAQNRVVDFDTGTTGYSVYNLGAGFALPTSKGLARIDLQLQNVFNTAYTPFLWRYKTYAYQMGRNLSTRVSVDL